MLEKDTELMFASLLASSSGGPCAVLWSASVQVQTFSAENHHEPVK